jgi:hypothetical protein
MAYGTIKVDTITFTDAGVDKSVTISGLVQNPTFSGNITVTGTISGNTVQGQTVSGATITGGAAAFTTVTGGVATITSGVFALGSASNPSISFNGDANSGLYSPGADQVAVATNGTGRLFVDANGTVRVNSAIQATSNGGLNVEATSNGSSSAPFTLLNRGTSNDTGVFLTYRGLSSASAETDYAYMQMLATDTSSRHGAIAFWTANSGSVTERLRITSAGNVGIGTSSVNALLEVNNSTAGGEVQRIEGNYDGSGSVTLTNWRRAGGSVAAALKYNDDSSPLCMSIGTTTSHEFRIRTADTDAITIDTSQRVGIGTSSPGKTLDVTGTARVSSVLTVGSYIQGTTQLDLYGDSSSSSGVRLDSSGRLGIGTSAPTQRLTVFNPTLGVPATSGTTQTNGAFRIGATGTSGVLDFGIGAAGTNQWIQSTDSNNLSLGYVLLLNPNGGNVGIGTTSPSNTLHVNSGATGTSAKFESTGSGSYLNITNSSGAWSLGATTTNFILENSGGEALRVDSSRRLLVGTSTALANVYIKGDFNTSQAHTPSQQFALASASYSGLSVTKYSASDFGAAITLNASRSDTLGTNTLVTSGTAVGVLSFNGNDGTNFIPVAEIKASVDGTPGANDMPGRLVFSTTSDGASSPTERLRITSAGLVGIGTTSPVTKLDITGANEEDLLRLSTGNTPGDTFAQIRGENESGIRIKGGGSFEGGTIELGGGLRNTDPGTIKFSTGTSSGTSTERARIDSSGRLLVGTSSSSQVGGGLDAALQVESTSQAGSRFSILRRNSNNAGPVIALGKTGGSGNEVVLADDALGTIDFSGGDGTDVATSAARIRAEVDGTPGANDMPGRLVFSTTSDGASSPTERLRITSAGLVGIGSTVPNEKLTVADSGSANVYIALQNSTTGTTSADGWYLGAAGTEFQIYGKENGPITFSPNSTERARIDASGRLGIGTSDPSSFLHVDSADTYGSVVLSRNGGAAGRRPFGVGITGPTDAQLRISASSDTLGANAFANQIIDITADGKVGIGTTTVDALLEVYSPTNGANLAKFSDAFNNRCLIVKGASGGVNLIAAEETNEASTAFGIAFSRGATEMGRFDGSGRLLVGTSAARSSFGLTPNLQVEGTGYDGGSVNLIVNNNSNNVTSSFINLCRSRGTTNGSTTVVQADDSLGAIAWCGADGSDLTSCAATIRAFVDGTPGAGDMPGRLVFSTTADGASSPTERMRISNGGKIYANTTTDPVGPSDVIIHAARASGNAIGTTIDTAGYTCYTVSSVTNGYAMWMYNTTESANVGSILINTASVSYTTTSDYRLKENVTPVSDGISRLQQLKPSRFNFIADPSETVDGFIAHEVQTVVPEAITGTKDAVDDDGNPVYQGIDQSKLVPLLTAALQEAVAKIESLEARLTAAGI